VIGVRPAAATRRLRLGPAAGPAPSDVEKLRDVLQRAMTSGAGVVRSAASLDAAEAATGELADRLAGVAASAAAGELANLVTVAGALLGSARAREESRGAHTRVEFPASDPAWRCRLVHGQAAGVVADRAAAALPKRTAT
jgi:L-aspartate oxidase